MANWAKILSSYADGASTETSGACTAVVRGRVQVFAGRAGAPRVSEIGDAKASDLVMMFVDVARLRWWQKSQLLDVGV